MTYLISTDVKGFSYYFHILGYSDNNKLKFRWEGLKENASKFLSVERCEIYIDILEQFNAFVIPFK